MYFFLNITEIFHETRNDEIFLNKNINDVYLSIKYYIFNKF